VRSLTPLLHLLTLWLAFMAAPSAHGCAIALVLAMDVSGSVDPGEYRLQTEGLAHALEDPAVADALTGAQAAIAVVQWSGVGEQATAIGWRRMTDAGAVRGLAAEVRSMPRVYDGSDTAVGGALRHAARAFDAVPDCWRRIVDLSGDGPENAGHDIGRARAEAVAAGIEINALAIEEAGVAVSTFYRRWAIGPGGFVEMATGHLDYARAIRAKLLRELARPAG
jgi:Ca-activated chloride channel family protein